MSNEPVDLSEVVSTWQGTLLKHDQDGLRTLYVLPPTNVDDMSLRDVVCGVLEKAEEEFQATGVVIALNKQAKDLGELVHQLCYVGGTITNQPFASNSNYVLVALDLM